MFNIVAFIFYLHDPAVLVFPLQANTKTTTKRNKRFPLFRRLTTEVLLEKPVLKADGVDWAGRKPVCAHWVDWKSDWVDQKTGNHPDQAGSLISKKERGGPSSD